MSTRFDVSLTVAIGLFALVDLHGVHAQSVNTYLANDGDNDTFDPVSSELAPDVGGGIPFTRYLASNHYYQSRWSTSGGIASFRDEMLLHALDLQRLDDDIKNFAVPGHPGTYTILPFIEAPTPGYVAYVEGGAPVDATTWWGQTFRMWPYRLNNAPVLICIKTVSLTGSLDVSTTPRIQLKNYAAHNSSFGTNKNHTALTLEYRQEFNLADPEAGWSPSVGTYLGIQEQALQAGDVVVVCQSIYSENIWYDLQNTMAAESFVRNQFIPAQLPSGTTTGYSYVVGGSWGGVIAATAAFLQPRIYAASGGWTFSDFGFGIGDMRDLRSFQYGALAMLPPSGVVVSGDFPQIHSIVDMLGVRFDGGTNPQWDVALLSANRRPGDLKVRVYGLESNEDPNANGFWSLDDAAINSNFDGRLRKFMEHGAAWGVVPGKNEYTVMAGNEWANIITAGPGPAADNIALIPSTPAPSGSTPVYADPYSHTLRHNSHLATHSGFLTPIDLGPAGHPNQPASIKTLGQGVWPGYRDSMRMVDLDGDGKQEVIFGNLDGFVHDLEISLDSNDWYRLDDQYKSPYLGRGTYALAGAGTGSAARGYFANARGQVWKLTSNSGININPAPLVQPDASFSYDGEIPYIFVGNFETHNDGPELLLLNRFLDWSMFDAGNGNQITSGRLQRNSHAVQPGQAAQCDIDGDGDLELLVPAADGHV